MSVKVSLSGETKVLAKSFPKLMIDEDDIIVLFSSNSEGVIIQGNKYYTFGWYSKAWFMDNFKDYNGEVTLKNE